VQLALTEAERRDMQLVSMQADSIAQVGCTVAAAAGVQGAKPTWYNPWKYALYVEAAKKTIKPAAAKLFLDRYHAQYIPSWVIQKVDMELIEASATPD
jgi:hypothetical protein